MSKIIYLDLENGISGDMLLGAFLDLGANQDVLGNVIQDLGLDIGLDIEDKEQGLTNGKDVNIT
ncbi:MAG: nickel insertion protein, partial [Thermoplasmatota archaeon]